MFTFRFASLYVNERERLSERETLWSTDTRVLLGFYQRITGGMLMTKPNYRGLITATFIKLITAKRRQALQVIYSVGC